MLSTRAHFRPRDTYRLKVKGWNKSELYRKIINKREREGSWKSAARTLPREKGT